MPRKAVTCPRMWRDGDDSFHRCDGPMTLGAGSGTWTCIWCGRILPAVYPPR